MYFLPDGYMRGRGVDSIGTFYIVGKADPDVSGWAWLENLEFIFRELT
jgi:hypothetical protein